MRSFVFVLVATLTLIGCSEKEQSISESSKPYGAEWVEDIHSSQAEALADLGKIVCQELGTSRVCLNTSVINLNLSRSEIGSSATSFTSVDTAEVEVRPDFFQ